MAGLLRKALDFVFGNLSPLRTKSLLGGIELDVISEFSKSIPIAVSNRRTEKGFNIADTSRAEPIVFTIVVVDNSLRYLSNKKKLEEMATKGEPIQFYFYGRETYDNIVVENIEEIVSKEQKNGLRYAISLKQIRTASLTENDVVTDWKASKSTGGSKITKSASTVNPTEKEVKIVEKERGKSAAKGMYDFGFGGKK